MCVLAVLAIMFRNQEINLFESFKPSISASQWTLALVASLISVTTGNLSHPQVFNKYLKTVATGNISGAPEAKE